MYSIIFKSSRKISVFNSLHCADVSAFLYARFERKTAKSSQTINFLPISINGGTNARQTEKIA